MLKVQLCTGVLLIVFPYIVASADTDALLAVIV